MGASYAGCCVPELKRRLFSASPCLGDVLCLRPWAGGDGVGSVFPFHLLLKLEHPSLSGCC